jgi:hypothetical protein
MLTDEYEEEGNESIKQKQMMICKGKLKENLFCYHFVHQVA